MKIVLLNVYLGQWPVWFPAFLHSCRFNPEVVWLFFTDCPTPKSIPPNVRFIPITIGGFSSRATERLGFDVQISHSRKLCDFRPAYGVIFEDYIRDYDFWGHCDVDESGETLRIS